MKKVLSTIMISSLLFTVGCSSSDEHGEGCKCSECYIETTNNEVVNNSNKDFLEFKKSSNNTTGDIFYEFVDPDTGVHYLYINGYQAIAITPMYNADGTLKTN